MWVGLWVENSAFFDNRYSIYPTLLDPDNFRVADYSGVDAIFVNTRAFTILIQSRLHRCWWRCYVVQGIHLNCNVAVGPRKLRPSGLDCRNSRIPVGATAIGTFPAFARVPLCDLPRTQIPASCFTPTTTNVMSSPCAVPLVKAKTPSTTPVSI